MATNRTADPQVKALNTARTRALTAAKKSLGLIAEAVARHQADLEAGNVPDATFTASVLKYEGQRSVLEAFGKLAGGEPAEPEPAPAGNGAVGRDDVAALIRVLYGYRLVQGQPGPDTPLGRLAALAWPDGVPQELLALASPAEPPF